MATNAIEHIFEDPINAPAALNSKFSANDDLVNAAMVLLALIAAIAIANETRKKIATEQFKSMADLNMKLTDLRKDAISSSYSAQISGLGLDAGMAGAQGLTGVIGFGSSAMEFSHNVAGADTDYQGKVVQDRVNTLLPDQGGFPVTDATGSEEHFRTYLNGGAGADEVKSEALQYISDSTGADSSKKQQFISDQKAALEKASSYSKAKGSRWNRAGTNSQALFSFAQAGGNAGKTVYKAQESEQEQNRALFEGMGQQGQGAQELANRSMSDAGQTSGAMASTLGSVTRLLAGARG